MLYTCTWQESSSISHKEYEANKRDGWANICCGSYCNMLFLYVQVDKIKTEGSIIEEIAKLELQ